MKTLIQLLITGLVINAAVQAGRVAWKYYEFKDAVQQEAQFGGSKTTAQLHARILELAAEHDVVMADEDVTVERRNDGTSVKASYVDTIPFVPRLYTREQALTIDVSVRQLLPLDTR